MSIINKFSITKCIEAICNFAADYKTNKIHTPAEIYKNTGYAKYYSSITQEQIIDVIKKSPSIVQSWLLFSEDKRFTPAWFFEQKTKKLCVVGYINENGLRSYEIVFEDCIEACGYMVRMEMEQFRKEQCN